MYNEGFQLLAGLWAVVLITVGAIGIFVLTVVFAYSHMYWQSASAFIGGTLAVYIGAHLFEYATRW